VPWSRPVMSVAASQKGIVLTTTDNAASSSSLFWHVVKSCALPCSPAIKAQSERNEWAGRPIDTRVTARIVGMGRGPGMTSSSEHGRSMGTLDLGRAKHDTQRRPRPSVPSSPPRARMRRAAVSVPARSARSRRPRS
jgi:hypothetical protein